MISAGNAADVSFWITGLLAARLLVPWCSIAIEQGPHSMDRGISISDLRAAAEAIADTNCGISGSKVVTYYKHFANKHNIRIPRAAWTNRHCIQAPAASFIRSTKGLDRSSTIVRMAMSEPPAIQGCIVTRT
jgi:hypothetical protein